MFYVYVLRSQKDGYCYYGQSKDHKKRLRLHNAGKVKSTRKRTPFILIGYKSFKTRNDARWFEYMLKKHGDIKKKFLKELEVLTIKRGRPPARRAVSPTGYGPEGGDMYE